MYKPDVLQKMHYTCFPMQKYAGNFRSFRLIKFDKIDFIFNVPFLTKCCQHILGPALHANEAQMEFLYVREIFLKTFMRSYISLMCFVVSMSLKQKVRSFFYLRILMSTPHYILKFCYIKMCLIFSKNVSQLRIFISDTIICLERA